MLTYRKRDHWEDREDTEWRIEADALVMVDAKGRQYRFPWKDIAGVRAEMKRKHSRMRFVCTIWLKDEFRSRCEFDDAHVVTVGEHEQRVDDFRAFALAVMTTIIEKAPEARAWIGAEKSGYFLRIISGAGALLLFAITALDPAAATTTKLLFAGVGLLSAYILVRDVPRTISVSELKARLVG